MMVLRMVDVIDLAFVLGEKSGLRRVPCDASLRLISEQWSRGEMRL